jgi:hypothetical protein
MSVLTTGDRTQLPNRDAGTVLLYSGEVPSEALRACREGVPEWLAIHWHVTGPHSGSAAIARPWFADGWGLSEREILEGQLRTQQHRRQAAWGIWESSDVECARAISVLESDPDPSAYAWGVETALRQARGSRRYGRMAYDFRRSLDDARIADLEGQIAALDAAESAGRGYE